MKPVSQRDLAQILGASKNSITRLIEVGYLPQPQIWGRSTYWMDDDIQYVLDATAPKKDIPAIMIKAVPASDPDPDEPLPVRAFRGWMPGLDPMHPDQMNGINRWHKVAEAERWIGDAFLVTSVGFVLAAYTITGVETVWGSRRFSLGPPSDDISVAYEGKRFPSLAGPLATSWGH